MLVALRRRSYAPLVRLVGSKVPRAALFTSAVPLAIRLQASDPDRLASRRQAPPVTEPTTALGATMSVPCAGLLIRTVGGDVPGGAVTVPVRSSLPVSSVSSPVRRSM